MGRGGAIYLSYTALVLLSTPSSASADSLWTVNIDHAPAPSPEDGPPFSYYATRDRALLPYQIIGIVAAYFGTVLIIGTLLLTVGRRLRKEARLCLLRSSTDRELVKPIQHHMDPSPMSYQGRDGWIQRASKKSSASSTTIVEPLETNGASFDNDVLERDRQNMQAGLANLYGAVYGAEDDLPSPGLPPSRPSMNLQVAAGPASHTQLPAQGAYAAPLQSPGLQARRPTSSHTNFSKPLSPTTSSFSPDDLPGTQSFASRYNRTPRTVPQRLPAIDTQAHPYGQDEARSPLAPRYYFEPRSPELPPAQTPADIGQLEPTRPATALDGDWDDQYYTPSNAAPRAWPQPNPQRPRGASDATLPPPLPPPPKEYTPSHIVKPAKSAGSLHNRLWLRSDDPAYPPTPSRVTFDTKSTIKHTEISFDRSKLMPGGMLTAGIKTPITAGMKTPLWQQGFTYSAETRAETRAERKQREREARLANGPIPEGLVPDDEEMWASNY